MVITNKKILQNNRRIFRSSFFWSEIILPRKKKKKTHVHSRSLDSKLHLCHVPRMAYLDLTWGPRAKIGWDVFLVVLVVGLVSYPKKHPHWFFLLGRKTKNECSCGLFVPWIGHSCISQDIKISKMLMFDNWSQARILRSWELRNHFAPKNHSWNLRPPKISMRSSQRHITNTSKCHRNSQNQTIATATLSTGRPLKA